MAQDQNEETRKELKDISEKEPIYPTKELESLKDQEQPEEDEKGEIVPPDGGWGWVIVVASFFASFILDGVIYAFSPYLEILRVVFNEPRSKVSWITSLTAGCAFLSGPMVSALANRYGLRQCCIGGAILSSLAMASTYFANSIAYLMVTQGILAGIGFGSIYLPCIVTVGIYFDKKRTLANGIAVCGSSVGVFVFPPLVKFLIDQFGWRGTNLIVSGIILNCVWLGALMRPLKKTKKRKKSLLDEHIPSSEEIFPPAEANDSIENSNYDSKLLTKAIQNNPEKVEEKDKKIEEKKVSLPEKVLSNFRKINLKNIKSLLDFSLFTKVSFLMVCAAHFCAFLAFYTPFVYLPAAAMQKGIDQDSATFLVSIIGITNTLGRVASGSFATLPFINPLYVHNISLMAAGTALIFIRFAHTYAAFATIACTFGVAMSSYIALTSPIIVIYFGLEKLNDAFGFIILFWGISSLVGAPLAGIISELTETFDASFYYSGSLFWACAILFCLMPFAQRLQDRRKKDLEQVEKIKEEISV